MNLQPREVLEADPEFAGLDFSGLEPDWISKKGIYDPDNVAERAKGVRKWLRARPEKRIVVGTSWLGTGGRAGADSFRTSQSRTATSFARSRMATGVIP